MATPKRSDPSLYTTGELLVATALGRRQIERLRAEGIGCYADEATRELAKNGLHDEDTVATVAVAAAVSAAGMPLPSAMRVVMAFLDTFPNHHPAVFANLGSRVARGGYMAAFAAEAADMLKLVGLTSAMDGDALLIVADNEYLFEGVRNPRIKPVPIPGVDMSLPTPIGKILNADLPERAVLEALADKVDASDPDAVRRSFNSYHHRLDNSRTVVSINMGLAIRVSFMLICMARERSGHPLPSISSESS